MKEHQHRSPSDHLTVPAPERKTQPGVEPSRVSPLRGFFYTLILAAALFAGYLAVVLYVPYPPVRQTLTAGLNPLLDLLAAAALFLGARRSGRASKRLSSAWGCLCAALIGYALGDAFKFAQLAGWAAPGYPSLADGFYLAAIPLIFLGVHLLPSARLTRVELWKKALDVIIVLVSASLVFWNYLIGPLYLTGAHLPGLSQALTLAYPVGDFFLFWALLRLLYWQIGERNQAALLLLAGGIAGMILTHSLISYPVPYTIFLAGSLAAIGTPLMDAFYALAGVLQAVAGKPPRPAIEAATATAANSTGNRSPSAWLPFFPYLWIILVYVMLTSSISQPLPMDSRSIAIWVGVVIAMVLLRQILELNENYRLNHRLHQTLEHLSQQTLQLQVGITERETAEGELVQADEKLKSVVLDLERRNHEADLLRQLGNMVQVCTKSEEAYPVIAQFCQQLFPGTVGALYLISNSRRQVEAVSAWGEDLQSERIFAPEKCWALQRGQMHAISSSNLKLACRHMHAKFRGSYLDLPLTASGEALGVLHIEGPDNFLDTPGPFALALSVAEHLELSFANLQLRETLRAQSIRDGLTGLFNRRYMEESLEREIHRAVRKRSPLGIIMLDIDHFKNFNDTYGHTAGDVVLRELGRLLLHYFRGEDIACRYGGEEFILILPDTSLATTRERAEKVRESVKLMGFEFFHQHLNPVSVSLGVAVFPDHAECAEEILRKVDEALYLAKRNGRDRVETAALLQRQVGRSPGPSSAG